MGWLSYIEEDEVNDAETYARYCQQRIGIPHPSKAQLVALNKQINEFFSVYPHTDYYTLIRVVDWAVARKRRYATVMSLLGSFRYAWAAGYLPELDPGYVQTTKVDSEIDRALTVESNTYWRKRLSSSIGESRQVVLSEWIANRGSRSQRDADDQAIQQFQTKFVIQ